MSTLLDEDLVVLERHSKALCHLRERKESDRIALFLGAGASKEFGFPSWEELIGRIENSPEFTDYIKPSHNQSLTFRTQSLEHFLRNEACSKGEHIDVATEKKARHLWISIVHRCLYKDTKSDGELLEHSYLPSFLSVIKESPLTVNYNFDDCLERMLAEKYGSEQSEKNERIYETVWDPSTQYKRSKGVIYHPNGFLPKDLINGHSDEIVFAEKEFADQLIQTMHGHYSTLISHLTRYTSILIGLSIDDPTLKHLLRQNTHMNPGHVHYWLKFCSELPEEDVMREERSINYDVYGIITLHLTSSEYSSFGRLLACSKSEYLEAADKCGVKEKYLNYVTGAVGAGKSSVVQKLKSLCWIGEWVDHRPTTLAKPHTALSTVERVKVDSWISNQFRKKDFKISEFKDGIIVCDRSPLDPLAFTEEDSIKKRAKEHIEELVPQRSSRRLTKGQVIFLSATGEELKSRSHHRHTEASAEYLSKQQDRLNYLYTMPSNAVKEVSTQGRTLNEVVRNVAKIIHLSSYDEIDIHSRISELAEDN